LTYFGKYLNSSQALSRQSPRLAGGEKDQKIHITIKYAAVFDDPVPVRPLNADNPGFGVSATITAHGSFLLAGSGWYPQWTQGHSNYLLKVIAPADMIAVTAGQSKGYLSRNGRMQSTWLISDPVQGCRFLSVPILCGKKWVEEEKITRQRLRENELLMVGYPQGSELLRHLPDQVAIHQKSFILNKETYDQSSDVFFGVFKHPFNEDRVAALFFPLSPQQAQTVARKITHYGNYSYLAFQNGQNRDKGLWPIEQPPLECRWSDGDKK